MWTRLDILCDMGLLVKMKREDKRAKHHYAIGDWGYLKSVLQGDMDE